MHKPFNKCILNFTIKCYVTVILRKPRRVFRLPTSDFRLPTSAFQLPTSVATKGGGRPTRLLPYAKMLLVSITFFLLLGRLCYGRFYIFYWANVILAARFTLTVVFVSGLQDLPPDERAFLWPCLKRKTFYYGWVRALIFLQSGLLDLNNKAIFFSRWICNAFSRWAQLVSFLCRMLNYHG